MHRDYVSKFTALKTTIPWLYIPVVLGLLITVTISYKFNIPIAKFTRDPAAITHSHPLLGIISHIGVLLWCSSAAICFFSYTLIQKIHISRDALLFTLFGCIIIFILLVDDLFLLHERIYPRYFSISERVTIASYAIIFLLYIIRFQKLILETNFSYSCLLWCFLDSQ